MWNILNLPHQVVSMFQCSGDGATFSHGQPSSTDAHGLRCLKVSTIENSFRGFCTIVWDSESLGVFREFQFMIALVSGTPLTRTCCSRRGCAAMVNTRLAGSQCGQVGSRFPFSSLFRLRKFHTRTGGLYVALMPNCDQMQKSKHTASHFGAM